MAETEEEKQRRRLQRLLQSGASQQILEDSMRASRPTPIDDSPGGLLGGILRLASNLDRPAGAVRSTLLGEGPVAGFKDPQDYSLVDPEDNPFMRFLGGAAEAVLDPLNLVGAKWMSPLAKQSSFTRKLAAEAGINLAARQSSEFAAENIPEDANPWIRGLGPLAAGIAGGAGAAGAFSRAGRTAIDELADVHPGADFAAKTTPFTTDLESALRHQDENATIAALGENSKKIREVVLKSVGTEEPPTVAITEAMTKGIETMEGRFHATGNSGLNKDYNLEQYTAALQQSEIAKSNLKALPEPIHVKGMPGWLSQTINGKINRSPLAHEVAMESHALLNQEMEFVGKTYAQTALTTKRLFGDNFEKVTLKGDAPTALKQQWARAQSLVMREGNGNYGYAPMGLVIRHPESFNLSPEQIAALAEDQSVLLRDLNISRDAYGIDVTPLETAYDPRAHYLVNDDWSELKAEDKLRLLGAERSFQKHRAFDDPGEIINSFIDPEYFRNKIRGMISTSDDADEIQDLQDILNSGLRLQLKPVNYATALADRLSQSAAARAEQYALQTLRANGGTLKEIKEMQSLIGVHKISSALELPAKVSAALRQAVLSADFSIVGTHSIGEIIMGGGMKGVTSAFASAFTSEEGWLRHMIANTDGYARAAGYGVEFSTEDFLIRDGDLLHKALKVGVQEFIDPVTGNKTQIKVGGNDINVLGRAVKGLDKIQYERAVRVMKKSTFDNTFDLLTAARDGSLRLDRYLEHPGILLQKLSGKLGKSTTDAELGRAAANFTNDLFGGLNRVNGGRTAAHNLLETLFVLTPGFTRGTLNIGFNALNPLKWDAESALARDFAIRGLVLAGTTLTGLSMAINGAGAPLPNITDPSKSDWMVLKLPGGKEIKPLSRWRSSGKIAAETVMKMAESGPLEAAVYFGPAALNWGTYRQGALITSGLGNPVGDIAKAQFGIANQGNTFSTGLGVKDLLLDPDVNTGQQLGESLVRSLVPAAAQQALETYRDDGSLTSQALKNIGFNFATEFFGVSPGGPTMLQQSIVSKGADWAANTGMDAAVIADAVANNRNPINVKNELGEYVLDSATRRKGNEALAAELGIDVDIVYRNGRLSEREKKSTLETIKQNQIDSFFQGMDIADKNYATTMGQIQTALDAGLMDFPRASSLISDARVARSREKGMVDQLNPAALVFLQSPDQLAKKNSKDKLFSAISAEYFSKDFFDPTTMSFDFDARNLWEQELRSKFPGVFDEWQAQYEAKKTPLERERDAAFDRLDTYFRIGDEIWQGFTGGAMGKNEKEFDGYLLEMFKSQGVEDPGVQNYLISQVKSNIDVIGEAKNITEMAKDILRASDPQMESDVTKWLGNQPVALKRMSRSKRAYINQLLLNNE